jgi:protein TonB
VELVFRVDEDGRVSDVEVVESEPEGLFVRTAVRAVKRWRFRPATRNGVPVPHRVRQRISFQVEDRR